MNKNTKPNRTIAQSAAVAGAFAADKRAEGFTVTIKTIGSDSKRGTQVRFIIEWAR